LEYIKAESGSHFDPMVVDAFMQIQQSEQRKKRKK
jgi:response regulator RpfG family c-di-GMP phosphodiesterase